MKFAIALTLVGTVGIATAQVSQSTPGTTPGSKKILESAYYRIGQQRDAWFAKGNFPAAIHLISFEVQWRPYDYEAVTNLGWMYGNIERPDLELAVYTRFAETFPNDPEGWYPLAEFYYMLKQYRQVITYLEPTMAMERKPHANSYRLLAHSYDRLGYFKQAVETWDRYLAINPDDAAAKNNRDRVAKKLDEQ